jgi:hypothetical protein
MQHAENFRRGGDRTDGLSERADLRDFGGLGGCGRPLSVLSGCNYWSGHSSSRPFFVSARALNIDNHQRRYVTGCASSLQSRTFVFNRRQRTKAATRNPDRQKTTVSEPRPLSSRVWMTSKPAGSGGDHTSASVNGAPSAKTTARTATHGTTSPMITHAHAPITGARMASQVSATRSKGNASRSLCGTARTQFSRNACSA